MSRIVRTIHLLIRESDGRGVLFLLPLVALIIFIVASVWATEGPVEVQFLESRGILLDVAGHPSSATTRYPADDYDGVVVAFETTSTTQMISAPITVIGKDSMTFQLIDCVNIGSTTAAGMIDQVSANISSWATCGLFISNTIGAITDNISFASGLVHFASGVKNKYQEPDTAVYTQLGSDITELGLYRCELSGIRKFRLVLNALNASIRHVSMAININFDED